MISCESNITLITQSATLVIMKFDAKLIRLVTLLKKNFLVTFFLLVNNVIKT